MPDIVYVDDETEGFKHLLPVDQAGRMKDFVWTEEGLGHEALDTAKEAKIWLFDFFLIEPTQTRSKDENGLSLFQKWRSAVAGARPTTVLISSALEKAVGEPLGPVQRYHVVAERHGVEWIGEKSIDTWRQLVEMAEAAGAIGTALRPMHEEGMTLGTYDLGQLCSDVLGVPLDAEWAGSARRQVDRARPPREVPIETPAATARAILGWLISRVLPYPSFLLTDAQAALRLQITPEGFRVLATAVEGRAGEDGRGKLSASRYTGPLASFLGRRWWRAGIDDLVWHLSESSEGFSAGLKSLAADRPIEQLKYDEPVLLSDANLVETDDIAEARDCVRVVDEDFPANVEPAWVRIADVKDDRKLAAKVVFEDRDFLEDSDP